MRNIGLFAPVFYGKNGPGGKFFASGAAVVHAGAAAGGL